MKLFKYGLPFAALAMLASCSNDNIDAPVENGAVSATDTFLAQFEVAFPATNDTRAGESFGGFEGAQAGTEESTVKNVQIFLFKKAGNSENDYVCVGQSDKWSPSMANGQNDVDKKVTLTVQIAATEAINTGTKTDNYFGLAVVNAPGSGFEVPTPKTTTKDATIYGNWASVASAAQEYGFSYTEGQGTNAKKYFTMTNAPQWDNENGTVPTASNIFTLVPLDDSKFAKSPNEPTGPAGKFFVQRGVAKVRINMFNDGEFNAVPSTVSTTHKVSLTNWGIDITNKKAYPVQVVEGLTWSDTYPHQYLAKGTNNAEMGHLWWAKDPNYASASEGDFYMFEEDPERTVAKGDYDYCLENTMNPKQMMQDRTTRVLFKGYYSVTGTFDEETGKAHSFIVNPRNDQAIDVEGLILDEMPAAGLQKLGDIVNTDTYEGSKVAASDYNEESLTNLQAVAILLGMDYTDAQTIADFEVVFYPYGETYYVARIRHFSDSETPLEYPGFTWDGKASSYDNEKHLGRYGVLRNNIYDVMVQNVKGFGSPTVPTPDPDDPEDPDPDDPKDPENYNINVVINVLKWAKRSYDYTLD